MHCLHKCNAKNDNYIISIYVCRADGCSSGTVELGPGVVRRSYHFHSLTYKMRGHKFRFSSMGVNFFLLLSFRCRSFIWLRVEETKAFIYFALEFQLSLTFSTAILSVCSACSSPFFHVFCTINDVQSLRIRVTAAWEERILLRVASNSGMARSHRCCDSQWEI